MGALHKARSPCGPALRSPIPPSSGEEADSPISFGDIPVETQENLKTTTPTLIKLCEYKSALRERGHEVLRMSPRERGVGTERLHS